jgi:hypothetical protein
MTTAVTKAVLRDYLHDALPEAEMGAVEKALRGDAAARSLLEEVRAEEDRGEHTIGAIWRREHLSCPTRDQLGGYLLQALDQSRLDYVEFHLTTVGCPFCHANLDDLQKRQAEAAEPVKARRRRIVNSSAGILRNVTGPN